MFKRVAVLGLIGVVLTSLGWAQDAAHGGRAAAIASLAFTHATVIDTRGGASRRDMTVVTSGRHIVRVGPSAEVVTPPGARVFDATGKYLIPGLWDMHAHALYSEEEAANALPLNLALGITGLRDPGSELPLARLQRIRRDVEAGRRLGPRLVFSGPMLDGPVPAWPGPLTVSVRDAYEARRAVARLKAQGADFIKVYGRLSRAAYFAVAQEARRQKLPFVGHVPDGITAREAAQAGQMSLEHLEHSRLGCSAKEVELVAARARALAADDVQTQVASVRARQAREILDSFDAARCAALMRELAARGTWVTPTANVTDFYLGLDPPADDPRYRYLPAKVRADWQDMASYRRGTSAEDFALGRHRQAVERRVLAAARAAGVGLLAGSDASWDNPHLFHGFTLHIELVRLVEAGLTPAEALKSATYNPARFLRREHELGTIDEGKLADLVLLDADPLADIRHTTMIRAVVQDGRLFDRPALDRLLAEVATAANR